MPNFPKKFLNEYSKSFKVKFPYNMSSAEKENYRQYMFAKMQYEELTNFLNSKNNALDDKTKDPKGYGKNEFGFEKELDEEMLNLLKEKTENLIASSKKFIDNLQITDKTKLGVSGLMYEARRDYESAVRVNTTLEGVEPNTLSYMAIYNQSNEATIDLGESEVSTVGVSSSSRLAIKYVDEKGQLQNGFFTKDLETGHTLSLSKYKEKYPRAIKVFEKIEAFMNDDRMTDQMHDDLMSDKWIDSQDMMKCIKEWKLDIDGEELYSVHSIHEDDFYMIQKSIGSFFTKNDRDKILGLKAGNNSNQRNTLMSDMADALGMPKLLAKSTSMTIYENGEPVHGNFMANAEGMDFNKIDPANPFFGGASFDVDYKGVVKDATDMVILDYICLNGDRHQNNMFYKFKEDNGRLILTGIQGIDNDLSFGTVVPEKDKHVKFIPPLIDISYISSDTREKVLGLTESKITALLSAKGLSEDEVNACWQRTKRLQDYLVKEASEVIVFDDKMTQEAAEGAFNSMVQDIIKRPHLCSPVGNVKQVLQKYEDSYNSYSPAEFKKAKKELSKSEKDARIKSGLQGLQQKVYVDSKSTIKNQSAKISKLYGKLWKPKDADIPEYSKMYDGLKDLDDTLKSFRKDKGDLHMTDDMKQNILAEKFKNIENLVGSYQNKIAVNPTRNDKKRIAITESIKGIAIDNRNSRERQVNEFNTCMAKAIKTLGNMNKRAMELKEKNPNGIEYKMAEMELKAAGSLSAYLGNAEMPKGQAKLDADRDIARLCLVGKLKDIKAKAPDVFNAHVDALKDDPEGYLDMLSNAVANNADFKKILSKINPANAIQLNIAEHVNGIADEIGVYEDIGITNLITEKSQVIGK